MQHEEHPGIESVPRLPAARQKKCPSHHVSKVRITGSPTYCYPPDSIEGIHHDQVGKINYTLSLYSIVQMLLQLFETWFEQRLVPIN